MNSSITVSQIFIYPVKSLPGLSVQQATLDERGFVNDRRWMLVNSEGVFLTQREFPRMALLRTAAIDAHWEISADDATPLQIPMQLDMGDSLNVEVWGDVCPALRLSGEADAWFSRFLDTNCHLVYMPDETKRLVDTTFAHEGEIVSFADGFPLLLISEASLDDINSRLDEAVDMRRFRPNLVVSGCGAFAEDDWTNLEIGGIGFQLVKPCARCSIISINPDTAEKMKEPMRTLATYRTRDSAVYFGQNAIHKSPGRIQLDDPVFIQD